MKTLTALIFLCTFSLAKSQSLIGNWQLVKQSNCMEGKIEGGKENSLAEEMKNMASPAPQVVSFKEKLAGEESTRILTKKKTANSKNFLYKFDGETLMILDKRSQTITDNYIVEKFSADSLIISNASRPCETRIFLRIK